MATYRIVNTFHATSGIVEDDCQNVIHFQTSEGAHTNQVGSALNGHVAAAYESSVPGPFNVSFYISAEISRVVLPTVKAYSTSGGSPIATDTWAIFSPAAGGISLPSEVACCLSMNADLTNVPEEAPDDPDADIAPERPASRRRGRLYIGPLQAQANDGATPARPSAEFQTHLRNFGNKLANPTNPILTAVAAELVVKSASGFAGASFPVIRVSTDNAWDTQRRRGRRATNRTFLAV